MRTGAELFVDRLLELEVKAVFAITGAGNLKLIDAINKARKIDLIFTHHEQAAVMAAQGYSRISGKPGIVVVTTGGGTSNTVTGVLSAMMDSDPVLIVSGNENSFNIESMKNLRAVGVQGFNSTKLFESITKQSTRISKLDEILMKLDYAWNLMTNNRPGPVHIDFPMDIQNQVINETTERLAPLSINQRSKKIVDEDLIDQILKDLEKSKNPIFYLGNGLRYVQEREKFIEILQSFNIPFFASWSAIDLFPDFGDDEIGRVGIYGDRFANIAIQRSDLVVCLGTRLSIPQTGYDKNDFGRNAVKWVIDIDDQELTKFPEKNWNVINADLRIVLPIISDKLSKIARLNYFEWANTIKEIKLKFSRIQQIEPLNDEEKAKYVHSVNFIKILSELIPQNSTIVTDVGAALLSTHYMFSVKRGQRLTTSQGLGEMGFGLPAATGAYFADSSKKIICINNDGSLMMNLQELQTIAYHKIPIKLFVLNNYGYTSIRISQQNLYDSNFVGIDSSSGLSFPDFRDIAKAFKLNYQLINAETENLSNKLLDCINDNKPYLIEVSLSPDQRFMPRLATKRAQNGQFVSPPLEDLDPMIDLELLQKSLGYEPIAKSFQIRN